MSAETLLAKATAKSLSGPTIKLGSERQIAGTSGRAISFKRDATDACCSTTGIGYHVEWGCEADEAVIQERHLAPQHQVFLSNKKMVSKTVFTAVSPRGSPKRG